MRMDCPPNTIDEHAARIVAGMVVALALLSVWPPATLVVLLILADFAIRGWGQRCYSPLCWIANRFVKLIKLQPRPTYAPPKRFAARIGAAITAVATILHFSGLHMGAAVVIGMLVIAASLETLMGFCIACWVYPFIYRGRGQTS